MDEPNDIKNEIADAENGAEPDNGRRLNRYLSELIHKQDHSLLTDKDLKSLVEKYKLESSDFEKLQMLIERHLARALEYKGKERWDNAIVETERALLFTPLDNQVRLDLAELYLNRSIQYGYLQKDLRRSKQQVEDALTLEPENREARKFQRELKKLQDMLKGRGGKKRYIPLLLIPLLILGIALYPRIRRHFQFAAVDRQELPAPPSAEWKSRELEWESDGELGEDFSLTLRDRTLTREDDTGLPTLSLSGYAESLKGSYEVLDIELYFDNRSLGTIPLVEDGEAPLREGETAVFSARYHPEGNLDTEDPLHFVVKEKKRLAPEEEAGWSDVDPYAGTVLPQGVFLHMDSRTEGLIEGYDRSYLFMDLRIKNRSMKALSRLDFKAQWRDEEDAVIAEKDISLIENKTIPMREGEIRTQRIMFSMDKDESARNASLQVLLGKVEEENNESQ